ncbi:MAG: substrate-binding domain-containing protein [Pseudomonadota bacterium]
MKSMLLIALILWGSMAAAETLRMAVTTSFHNSGLADVLLPEIKADTGLDLQLLVVGTGQAMKLGRAGDVDAILVHAKPAELDFVANGFGTHRREIMYNDFIILGPKDDVARLRDATTAAQALTRIAQTGSSFVSRGDDSGTHKAELTLWQAAGITPKGPWYKSVGAGMGAALNTASGLNAYILSDRASWLNFGNPGDLTVLFEGDPALFNQYSLIPVSPDRHPHIRADLVADLEAWLKSPKAEALITGYRLQGEPLFVFNATR